MPIDDSRGPDPFVARLMALASVGTEMAAPIVVGLILDLWLGWVPALTIAGAVIGMVGGVYHLVVLNRPSKR